MIWCYLKTDIVGVASNIVYGEQGDRVHVIKNEIDMILVIAENGNRFFVKADDISNTPIDKKTTNESRTNQSNNRGSVQRVRSKKI